jgi:hypothetical protein
MSDRGAFFFELLQHRTLPALEISGSVPPLDHPGVFPCP